MKDNKLNYGNLEFAGNPFMTHQGSDAGLRELVNINLATVSLKRMAPRLLSNILAQAALEQKVGHYPPNLAQQQDYAGLAMERAGIIRELLAAGALKEKEAATQPKEYSAVFERLGNDLFWSFYPPTSAKKLKWTGYDDAFWWEQVSIKPQQRQQKDSEGQVWQISFKDNTVVKVEEQ